MSEHPDQGGDPACWAHLVDEEDGGAVAHDDTPLLDAAGDGAHRTLEGGDGAR